MEVNCCVWADGAGEANACWLERRAVSSVDYRLWRLYEMTDEMVTVDFMDRGTIAIRIQHAVAGNA
jgi:hypothetical protein